MEETRDKYLAAVAKSAAIYFREESANAERI
jgi:hypothetical protein